MNVTCNLELAGFSFLDCSSQMSKSNMIIVKIYRSLDSKPFIDTDYHIGHKLEIGL